MSSGWSGFKPVSGSMSAGRVREYCGTGANSPGIGVRVSGITVAARAVADGRYNIPGLGVNVIVGGKTVRLAVTTEWFGAGINMERTSRLAKVMMPNRPHNPRIATQMINASVLSLEAFIGGIIPLYWSQT